MNRPSTTDRSRSATTWSVALLALLLATAVSPRLAAAEPPAKNQNEAEKKAKTTPLGRYLADWDESAGALERAGRGRRGELADAVRELYRRRDDQPAWIVDGQPRPAARELIRALKRSGEHALYPRDYRPEKLALAVDAQDGRRRDGEEAAALDVELTAAFMLYASHLVRGRFDPDDLDIEWHVEPRKPDLANALDRALERGIAPTLTELAPPYEGYDRLLGLLDGYRQRVADGGWPEVPDGPVLEAGDEGDGERLAALIDRLSAEGDLSPRQARRLERRLDKQVRRGEKQAKKAKKKSAGSPEGNAEPQPETEPARPLYGEQLAAAVERFQRRHGLEIDGKVGPETMAALNISAEERVRQIELNLERWRWMPEDPGGRQIWVNIPEYRLRAFDGDRAVMDMKVVVGRETWQTPVFRDRMTYVEVNPYWNVPTSIAAEEVVPAVRRDPGYIAKKNFQVLNGDGSPVDPAAVDWSRVTTGDYRIRQLPGSNNALGQIKFMFPNQFNVYLHDTPAEQAFETHERSLSHGCVRVERPLDLARFVFARHPEWDAERVRSILGGENERVPLDEEIPVSIVYFTALLGDDGKPHFRDDIYDQDRELEAELERRYPSVASD